MEELSNLNKSKNSRIRGALKIGVDPLMIFITSVATLSFGIIGSFVQNDPTGT